MRILPSREMLAQAMGELGCRVNTPGWCHTHNSSLLIHDGGRIGCAAAWEKVQS